MKELDYEISHGRYTLIVTATDQCPIPSRRLTTTTTVRSCHESGVHNYPRSLDRGVLWEVGGVELATFCAEVLL